MLEILRREKEKVMLLVVENDVRQNVCVEACVNEKKEER